MSGVPLKDQIREALTNTAAQFDYVQSVTLTGSFAETGDTVHSSDIDCIVIVDSLNANRFGELQKAFLVAVRVPLFEVGLEVRINTTLGPLKLDTPSVAVLHLMIYTAEGHAEHVLQSPFTCLDWQRSPWHTKSSLQNIFPTFKLQPRHFFGARRSAADYLKDLLAGVVSYREIVCDENGVHEQPRTKPMGPRDRGEFAYHIVKFLMTNFLKLIQRSNKAYSLTELNQLYFDAMPKDRIRFESLLPRLAKIKLGRVFQTEEHTLNYEAEAFVRCFEIQFRQAFDSDSTKHLVFRHVATAINGKPGKQRTYQGRINPEIKPVTDDMVLPLVKAAEGLEFSAAFISPALRCQQSFQLLASQLKLPQPVQEERIWEYNYGEFKGSALPRQKYATLTSLPHGQEVKTRDSRVAKTRQTYLHVESFVKGMLIPNTGNTVTCTHNGVLRAMVGETLGVPRQEWFKLILPHLGPVTFVATKKWGLFVNLNYEVERVAFDNWWPKAGRS